MEVMFMQRLVRFTFYFQNTSISRITEHETLEQVEKQGPETVANKCVEEVKHSVGLDLKALVEPDEYLTFCSFIELYYNPENNELVEKGRLSIK